MEPRVRLIRPGGDSAADGSPASSPLADPNESFDSPHRRMLPANQSINPSSIYLLETIRIQQECVEPPPSALNMTLSAPAAERRRLQQGAGSYRSISPARRALSSKKKPPATGATVDRWDRQTDRQTDGRPTVAPHTIRAASEKNSSRTAMTTSDRCPRVKYVHTTLRK